MPTNSKQPIPQNELERLTNLSEFDLDYSNLNENFKDLTLLAAKIAGSEMSLVNIIDSFTIWTVARHGLEAYQNPREDSVCQYTIVEKEDLEIPDLSNDDRFKDMFYVTGAPFLKHYYGVALQTGEGVNIGSLCLMDTYARTLDPEKTELLKIIASEVVSRLKALKAIANLQKKVKDEREITKRLAHDIRGPLAGVIGLTEIVAEQAAADENSLEEIQDFIGMINKSSTSILDLANEILTAETKLNAAPELSAGDYNLIIFKEKLIQLYLPQAMNKQIIFTVKISSNTEVIPFSKNKLLQIAGNLISNAIKFTPERGNVCVDLKVKIGTHSNELYIVVKDSGIGISSENIAAILQGVKDSSNGTNGELGYGFGLPLVKHLVDDLGGTLKVTSKPNEETAFEVMLPQAQ